MGDASNERPRPRRGAFPTPRSELARARPYIPDDTEVPAGNTDDPAGGPEQPAETRSSNDDGTDTDPDAAAPT